MRPYIEHRPIKDRGEAGDPSPAEIAAACLRIQQGWTPAERRSRSTCHTGHWRAVVPVFSAREFGVEELDR